MTETKDISLNAIDEQAEVREMTAEEIFEKSKFALETENLTVEFNGREAISDINLKFRKHTITAIIGPSGCGKSTFLRSLNFMHDLTPGAVVSGSIKIHGRDISEYEMTEVRRKVGMVFQKPNPFPTMSVYENVTAGLTLHRMQKRKTLDETVERSLRLAGLWEETKDRLKVSAMALSGGQQQRLCIARTLAINPEIILFDEPTSALDPISTSKIEETLHTLRKDYTIIIVTHNMQQASRLSDYTSFFYMGKLIEHSKTRTVFTAPKNKLTEEYVIGKFG